MRENFLTPDLSISANFEQLWFWWQKSPLPPNEAPLGKFFDTRSIHFRQFWATLVLVAEKPPPDEGKSFDARSIHFRQFWATLVLVIEKLPPRMRETFFLTPDLSISGNLKQLWFWWQKSPPPGWGKFFDTRSIHFGFSGNFEQIYFGFGGRKSTPPPWGKIFWHQIYPFQAILSNFGFGSRKAEKPPPDEGKFFDTRSIHFSQFQATLVLVAEKPPPPMRENFLTPDLSMSGNYEQLWFWWQKSHPPLMRENHLTPDLSISGNFEQLWFWWQKSPPPPDEGKFLTPDLSISGNFEQLWFWSQKSSPTQDEGNFFDTRSIHFRESHATFVLVAEKAPLDEGNFFDTRYIHFRQFWATLVLVAEKPSPPD